MSRRAELAANLAALDRRLAAACALAGRDRAAVTLVAVSKTWPATDVATLAGLGVRDFGENRDQEAAPKTAAVAELLGGRAVRWHFVGQLQTNKCRSVARYADVVHSVDRQRLLPALSAAAARAGRTVDILIQVRLDDDPARGGVSPADLPRLADAAAHAEHLRLRGVMAVAPLDGDPAAAFADLAAAAERLRRTHPDADWISAGMTGDLEPAIAAGSTHVRVGTALFGGRPPVVG